MVKDPVCGMEVDPLKSVLTSFYQGETYYFCSYECKKAFDKEPGKYIVTAQGEQSGHLHPTLVKDPVCGMDVDPLKSVLTSFFQEHTYYFCSYECKKSFDKEPLKYIAKS